MQNISWKFVEPLKNEGIFEAIEDKYQIKIPADLKECIKKHNAGAPLANNIDNGDFKGVFGGLLSFNENNEDSFFEFVGLFENSAQNGLSMLPFGIDPAGGFFCVKNNEIVFYDHETGKSTKICSTFNDFLSLLHEKKN